MEAHLRDYFFARLGQEMGVSHPSLKCSKGMFNRRPVDFHGVGFFSQPTLNVIQYILVFLTPNTAQLFRRSTRLEVAIGTGCQVSVEVDAGALAI